MAKLLIVDDEPSVVYSLEKRLRTDTLQVVTAATATDCPTFKLPFLPDLRHFAAG